MTAVPPPPAVPGEPTPDEIARWAALAEQERVRYHGVWPFSSTSMYLAAVDPVNVLRLLALVAAQAEQNAELRGEVRCGSCTYIVEQITAERDAARAELSALRATDDYQRWARAVTERDAARERITKALHFVNHELADAVLTEFDHGAHSALAVVRAALDQPTPREETPT